MKRLKEFFYVYECEFLCESSQNEKRFYRLIFITKQNFDQTKFFNQ